MAETGGAVKELHVTLRGGTYNDCRTPPAFFQAAAVIAGGFSVDAAAFEDTALVGNYFGPDHPTELFRDALNPDVSWCDPGKRAWLNPPYGSNLPGFVKAALHQARSFDVQPWLLVPARTETEWFNDAMSLARNVYFLRGRLLFLKRDGSHYVDKDGKPTGAGFPSALIEIHRFGGHPRVTWGWRWEKLLAA